jgi:hypothetical protein
MNTALHIVTEPTPEITTKVCSKCNIEKPIEKFPKSLHHNYQCKSCTTRQQRQWHRDHPGDGYITYSKRRLLYPEKCILKSAKARVVQLAKKGIVVEFNITKDDIFIPKFCEDCGCVFKHGVGNPCDTSPSIDKIFPEFGYTRGNVRVICYKCNTRKGTYTLEQLEQLCITLRKYKSIREAGK